MAGVVQKFRRLDHNTKSNYYETSITYHVDIFIFSEQKNLSYRNFKILAVTAGKIEVQPSNATSSVAPMVRNLLSSTTTGANNHPSNGGHRLIYYFQARMGLLLFAYDARFVLATLGVAFLFSTALGRFTSAENREDAEVKPVTPKTQYITQETEDSLNLSTLDSLLGHYNFAIRETAAKIVCDRAVNDPAAIHQLLYGITRPDYDERITNLRALAMITDQRMFMLLTSPTPARDADFA
jgi:hypothetical protein